MASKHDVKKNFNYKGLKFRTWLSFLLFSIFILALLWVFQIVIFKGYYQQMKKTQMETYTDRLVEQYGRPGFGEFVRDLGFLNGMEILGFSIDDEGGILGEFSSFGNIQPDSLDKTSITEFISYLDKSAEGKICYTLERPEGKEYDSIVSGRKVAYETKVVYFYLQAPIEPMNATTAVLANQLIIVTVICLFLAFALSVFMSKKLATPITSLNESAKQLAKGNYDARFESSGYSEVDDLAETLNYATSEMKKTDELRRDLIANISHELRTPLTMVKAYAEMIRDLSGDNPKKRNEHVQVILDESNRLAALVTDILDLSKIQSSTDELDTSLIDLAQLVREISVRFQGLFVKEGYELIVNVPEHAYIIADGKKMGQVIYNLIGNALNYSGEEKRIVISVVENDNIYRFSVRDYGKGIAAEDLEHIWDRYFRSAESKRAKIGSGIGLSIVKGICEAHCYRYGVESELGHGTMFWVNCPKVEPNT